MAIKDIANLFRLQKEIKAMRILRNREILRDTKNLLQHKEEEGNYHKPVRLSNFWNKNDLYQI